MVSNTVAANGRSRGRDEPDSAAAGGDRHRLLYRAPYRPLNADEVDPR